MCTDPGKQFDAVRDHIHLIKCNGGMFGSNFFVFVERNLGFESEHHKRALQDVKNVHFYVDQQANRVGILTTEQIKHAMCQLVVAMLKERRIHVRDPLFSANPVDCRNRLREQMEVYGYQVKVPANTFQKERIALSGKIG